jgi:hypothetical protein
MKFYIASRVKHRMLVEKIHKQILGKGHEFVSTWVKEGEILPYEKHIKASQKRAEQCMRDVSGCDVFVLISDDSGCGMYTELGIALSSNIQSGRPKIYIIGDYINRSVFFFHAAMKRVGNIEEVFKDIEKSK